jgi:uncharacterized phage infection (PIP) family protein YhgE
VDFKFDFQNWDNALKIIYLILPGIIFFETYRKFVEKPYPSIIPSLRMSKWAAEAAGLRDGFGEG